VGGNKDVSLVINYKIMPLKKVTAGLFEFFALPPSELLVKQLTLSPPCLYWATTL